MVYVDKNGKTLELNDVVKVPNHPHPMKIDRLLVDQLIHIVDSDVEHEDYQFIIKSECVEKI
jgi:hypothetical protein